MVSFIDGLEDYINITEIEDVKVLYCYKICLMLLGTFFSCILLFSTASSRSSHRRCSIEIGVVKILIKFTGKHLCQSLFKVTGLRPATLLKKRLWHRCFHVNFVKLRVFYRTPPDDCFYNSYLMHDV